MTDTTIDIAAEGCLSGRKGSLFSTKVDVKLTISCSLYFTIITIYEKVGGSIMEHGTNKHTHRIWTIPNVLSMIRLLLIPVIIWLYISRGEYRWTLAVLMLSAATDIIDGIIARKYDLVSDFGKALDPVADKLTQLVMLACLVSRFPKMLVLVILLVVKEAVTGIMSLIAIRKSNAVFSSEWHGKLTTVMLYATMMLHLLWYAIPGWISDGLMIICAGIMLYSAVRYFMRNIRQFRCNTERCPEQMARSASATME